MTVYKIAIFPQFCDRCKRWFWMERYITRIRQVGIEQADLKVAVCKKCLDKEVTE